MVTGLTVSDVVVHYLPTGQRWRDIKPLVAVDNVSLHVEAGEIVVLLGASGSGKSSLLRGIAGLEPLSSGRVCWDSVDITDTPTHQRGFGMMFQDAQLFPTRTVAGNVAYGLHTWSPSRRREQVERMLDLVGLAGYGSRRVDELSGGQAQRVALARSLAPNPRVLLLDEPLSALDRALRESLADEVARSLRATNTTAIYVTHDHDEAFRVADRLAVMADGQLLQIDEPAIVLRQPASRTVAEFLGYGPFVDAATAQALGYVGVMGDHVQVGLAASSLVLDVTGLDVPVLATQSRRGYVDAFVQLPDGQHATVRMPDRHSDPSVRVRIDPGTVVHVPAVERDRAQAG